MARGEGRRRSTIYDIAAAAGTSTSTVSLVLNGNWQRYRINVDTAARVEEAAGLLGYKANQRARGLRLKRSSLAGMAIPHYRNRFFAGLAESFEAQARERGLCPIVVSTQRDRATERTVVQTLAAQQAELIIIAGVDEPEELDAICVEAGIPCVNLDLPGTGAPSVVSDNRGGAARLTGIIMDAVKARRGDETAIRFVGGNPGDYATRERIAGFTEALNTPGDGDDGRIVQCGYHPSAALALFESWASDPANFPPGIFVNSITALEGFAAFLRRFPDLGRTPVIGCFDWDPFAAALPVSIAMLRQDVERMIAECFVLIDSGRGEPNTIVTVPPALEVLMDDGAEAAR